MRQIVFVLLFVLAAGPAAAQAPTELQQLQQQVRQRDAVIQDLLRRMEALEKKVQGLPAAPQAQAQAPVVQAAPAPAPTDEESVRALERALVRAGGLVLPPRAVEFEPRYQYGYEGNRALGIVPTTAGAQVAQASARRERHELDAGLRIGLPWRSQLALRLPYAYLRSRSAAPALGFDQSEHRSGLGDFEVQLTRQWTEDAPGRPALLGSLAWKAANGGYRPGLPSPGTGFSSFQAALTAVKRQDPLVFVGSLSYSAPRSRTHGADHVEPGDTTGIRLDTLLAASPQSSLRFGLDLARTGRTRTNGVPAAGSETVAGMIELGLTSVLSKSTSFDLGVGFGVTPDAPRLRIGVGLPIRFD